MLVLAWRKTNISGWETRIEAGAVLVDVPRPKLVLEIWINNGKSELVLQSQICRTL